METAKTKEKILNAATILFSDRGYDNVSMRDIAAEVGINAASIYNHFPSKKDILTSIYGFYAAEHSKFVPPLEDMLAKLETESIHNLLLNLINQWMPHIQEKMDRIILIASQRICLDRESETFIHEHFFEPVVKTLTVLIKRAVELGQIEPIDSDAFSRLAAHYAFNIVDFKRTVLKTNTKQWNSGVTLLLSLLKPVTPYMAAPYMAAPKKENKNGKY